MPSNSRQASAARFGAILGAAFLLAGLGSHATALMPMAWGNPSWEVATLGEISATMGLPVLGLCLLAAGAVGNGQRGLVVAVAVVLALIGAASLLAAVTVGTTIPLVWSAARTAATPEAAMGMKGVTVKAAALSTVYGFGTIVIAVRLMTRSLTHR